MSSIDINELRDYLVEECGSAAFSGFPAAIMDIADIEVADGVELCRIAERKGIELSRFEVDGRG